MTSRDPEGVPTTYWVLVLSDWFTARATVTVTLRGGVQLGPGLVSKTGGNGLPGQLRVGHSPDNGERKWDFDLSEVIAVEAQAQPW